MSVQNIPDGAGVILGGLGLIVQEQRREAPAEIENSLPSLMISA
jgi:hypothetical protein